MARIVCVYIYVCIYIYLYKKYIYYLKNSWSLTYWQKIVQVYWLHPHCVELESKALPVKSSILDTTYTQKESFGPSSF